MTYEQQAVDAFLEAEKAKKAAKEEWDLTELAEYISCSIAYIFSEEDGEDIIDLSILQH